MVQLKPWPMFKSEFSLGKNNHFYWIQLNNAIPKAWKENLYKGDKNFHDLTFSGHHIIKKYQIYSLSKHNSKELYSLQQVSLNDTKTKSQIYFEKLFPNKEIEWKCIYLMPRRVTIDTNLRIFQYKILNNALYLNEKLFKLKIVSSPLCSFCNSENETPIDIFYSCNQTESPWSKLQESWNFHKMHSTAKFLPQNTAQSVFFGFPDNEKNLKPLIISILYLSIICLNSRLQEK